MTGKLKGKLSHILSTHRSSKEINQPRKDQSDWLTEDWELITKDDLEELEKRLSMVSRDVKLDKRFEKERKYTHKERDKMEDRLKKLKLEK